MILIHGNIPTMTGDFIRSSLEQAQMEIGLGIIFITLDYTEYGELFTDSWVKCTWEFTSRFGEVD